MVTALHHTDEALAHALGDMYTEEFAREQQLGELQTAGQHGPLRLASGPHPMVAGPQHSGAGLLRTPGPGAAQQQQPPRLGRMLGAAVDSGGMGTQASPPSPVCVGPPGFGRSLAPLLPQNSAGRPFAANALMPALPVPGRPTLPPLRPTAPAGDGSSAPPAAAHQASATPQSLPTPPAPAPPSAAAASSSGWATFGAADGPPWQPCHSTPATPSAASPDGAVMHGNPLGSFDGTVPNPLGAAQTPLVIQPGPQHSAVPSPVSQDDTATSSFWPCAANMQNCHQAPSRPADGRLAPYASAQQLPDLIHLQSPEPPPLQPAPTASAVAMPGTTSGHCD